MVACRARLGIIAREDRIEIEQTTEFDFLGCCWIASALVHFGELTAHSAAAGVAIGQASRRNIGSERDQTKDEDAASDNYQQGDNDHQETSKFAVFHRHL